MIFCRNLMRALAVAGFGLLVACAGWAGEEPEAAPRRLVDPALREVSGMAVSPGDGAFLWLINDSGSPAVLHLADRLGRSRGEVSVEGVRNVDWEDLAAFRWQGRSWLLVGDIGDNNAVRDSLSLHLLAEPELPEGERSLGGSRAVTRTLEFRYPDGPRDCESLAVDARAGWIYLLSKRDPAPRLYRLPLSTRGVSGMLEAEFLGETAVPSAEGLPFHPYGRQPTGLDISADGRTAVVLTYTGASVVHRRAGESWLEAFAEPWKSLGAHTLPQAEAVAIDRRAGRVLATSEGAAPRLWTKKLE